jgi:glucosamine-6-phosphate deaminase
MKITKSKDKKELGQHAAATAAEFIRSAIRETGQANIIVATGASQFEVLEALVKEKDIAWQNITAFHLDEYVGLPITHPASFRKYLWERFVSQLPLPLKAFHYIAGDTGNPAVECNRLKQIIKDHPIDVAFVGIGENGHLAFNDPPADFTTNEPYLVVNLDEACRKQQSGEGWFKTLADVPKQAISMSCRQIMQTKTIIVSVPDARKAKATNATLEGPVTNAVPASILQQHENCFLFLEPASASLLEKVPAAG